MGNPRFRRSLGLFLVAISAIFTYNLYVAILSYEADLQTLLMSGIVVWGSLCLPELATGVWLIVREVKIAESDDGTGLEQNAEKEVLEPVIEAITVCTTCDRRLEPGDDVVCPHCEYVVISSLL